jgi:hypothetical protein
MIKWRRVRWAGNLARMRVKTNEYRVLFRNPEGKRSLGGRRRRWEDNIKQDFLEIDSVVME